MSCQDPSIYLGGCWVWCSAGLSSAAEAALTAEVKHYLSLKVSLHTAVTPALIRQPYCTLPFISEFSWHSVTWTPPCLCFSTAKDYWQTSTSTSAQSNGVKWCVLMRRMCWHNTQWSDTPFSPETVISQKHTEFTDQKITESRECRTLQHQPGTKHLATMHNILLTT